MLCVQRGTGVTADRLRQFRRGQGNTDPENTPAGTVGYGVFRGILDGAQYDLPEPVYPDLHESNAGDTGRGTRNCPQLRAVVSSAAVQYFFTYYFQSIMEPGAAFVVSVARGLVISGILILVLPALGGASSLRFAMPVTKLLVMVYAGIMIGKYTKAQPDPSRAAG